MNPWKNWVYGGICAGLLSFLAWADATGYVLFGAASKSTPSHSTINRYHK